MAYTLEISEEIDKKLCRLKKKDKKQFEILLNKVDQIVERPYHFKPLRGDMHGARRVHVGKSFVLTYEIDEENKIVRLLDYEHHDEIY